jgi:hypothetical protein
LGSRESPWTCLLRKTCLSSPDSRLYHQPSEIAHRAI